MADSQLEGSGQETIDTIIFSLVVGHNAHAYSIDMDQLMRRGVDDPCSRGEVQIPSACSVSKSNVSIRGRICLVSNWFLQFWFCFSIFGLVFILFEVTFCFKSYYLFPLGIILVVR